MELTQRQIELMRSTVNNTGLDMSCVIEGPVREDVDADGQPITTWATVYEGECHYWEQERFRSFGQTEVIGPNINIVYSGPRMILPATTNVNEGCRVAVVRDQFGNIVNQYVNIREVHNRITDVTLLLEGAD